MTDKPNPALVEAVAKVLFSFIEDEITFEEARRDNDAGYAWVKDMAEAAIATARPAILAEGGALGIERAARAAEEQIDDFLSPEYTTGQPFASILERFACKKCAEAIRALNPAGDGAND